MFWPFLEPPQLKVCTLRYCSVSVISQLLFLRRIILDNYMYNKCVQVKKWLFDQEMENTILLHGGCYLLLLLPLLQNQLFHPAHLGQLSSTTAGYAYTVYVVSLTGDLYSGHVGRVVCVSLQILKHPEVQFVSTVCFTEKVSIHFLGSIVLMQK